MLVIAARMLPTEILALLLSTTCLPLSVTAIWPAPSSMTNGTGIVRLAADFQIRLDPTLSSFTDLQAAVRTASNHVVSDNLQRLIVGRGLSDKTAVLAAPSLSALSLSILPNCSSSVKDISKEAILPLEQRKVGPRACIIRLELNLAFRKHILCRLLPPLRSPLALP